MRDAWATSAKRFATLTPLVGLVESARTAYANWAAEVTFSVQATKHASTSSAETRAVPAKTLAVHVPDVQW